MFKRKCKITFISHGATVHTMDGIICDTEKYPKINEFGEEEIEKVCEYLENRAVTYDKIYTSSSARCTQSAQIIAKLFKKEITSIDLPARNHGNGAGVHIRMFLMSLDRKLLYRSLRAESRLKTLIKEYLML